MIILEFTAAIFNQEFTQSVTLGILVASAFPIGAAVATARKFPKRIKGNLVAIAAGIYFSTLAFSLVEAIKVSSFPAMAFGFAIGAVSFSIAHPVVKERKKLTKILSQSSSHKKEEEEETDDKDNNKSRSRNEKRRNTNNQKILLLVK